MRVWLIYGANIFQLEISQNETLANREGSYSP